jgi:hypothetical protein
MQIFNIMYPPEGERNNYFKENRLQYRHKNQFCHLDQYNLFSYSENVNLTS